MIEKLKTGEFIATVEPPSSSYGSFLEHLLHIKCVNNEYQLYHFKNCLDESNTLKNNKSLTLTDLALNSLGQSFNTNSKYDELLDKHRQHLLQSLPTNTPLKVTALLIEEENH
ncbi:unnamed protein product [Rotaria sordida]|uniref:Uncharacterized protein n=2 Tax=Rotaria sordida TaxID=392033 RepID=A0A814W907_9BILA|nr:unnamed protein product [Rotaria sordida]